MPSKPEFKEWSDHETNNYVSYYSSTAPGTKDGSEYSPLLHHFLPLIT